MSSSSPLHDRSSSERYEAGATVLMAMWAFGAVALFLTGHGAPAFLFVFVALVIERQTRLGPGFWDRLYCRLIAHWPALVGEPCRCRRCGRMIRWNGNGGWRLTRTWEFFPNQTRRPERTTDARIV